MNQSDRSREQLLAWGGVVGPAAFVASWAALGSGRAGYSQVGDAISRLAETGASTRPTMTAGFVIYGAGLAGYAAALRRGLPGASWIPAAGCALATFGVAAFPLGTTTSGTVHAAFAVIGYGTLAGVPLVAASTLRSRGHRVLAATSTTAGVLVAGLLAASAVGAPAHGLTQRAGLSLGDAWVMVSAVALIRTRRHR